MADLIGKVESNELLIEVVIIGTGPRGLPGPKGDPGGVTAESIREALGYTPADNATAMEYKVLGFNGSAFLDESGNTLDFSTLHELCLDKKNFVYVSYSNRLYIPQYINTNNVWFEAAYIDNEVPYMHRLGINSRNSVNVYTKALAVKSDMDAAKESIATLESAVEELNENKADKSEIPDVPVTDVQVNGTSIVENGVANVPVANDNTLGLVRPASGSFFMNTTTGAMSIKNPTEANINSRASDIAVTTARLDLSVKAAMCDGKGAAWTEAEQAAARARIGIAGDFTKVFDVTLTEAVGKVVVSGLSNITECFVVVNADRNVTLTHADTYFADADNLIYGKNCTNNAKYTREYYFRKLSATEWVVGCLGDRSADYFGGSTSHFLVTNRMPETFNNIEIRGSWNGSQLFDVGCRFVIYGR